MFPYTMGRDVSGTIAACGAGVASKEGDAVYAMLGIERGGYAHRKGIGSGAQARVNRPCRGGGGAARRTHGLAGPLPVWRAEGGAARPDRRGGSGGVGHYAIQFAKAKGAYVITTAAGNHLDFVRSIGADEAIDYKRQRFEEVVHDVDLVYGLIGSETQERSFGVLKKGGILVSTLTEPN